MQYVVSGKGDEILANFASRAHFYVVGEHADDIKGWLEGEVASRERTIFVEQLLDQMEKRDADFWIKGNLAVRKIPWQVGENEFVDRLVAFPIDKEEKLGNLDSTFLSSLLNVRFEVDIEVEKEWDEQDQRFYSVREGKVLAFTLKPHIDGLTTTSGRDHIGKEILEVLGVEEDRIVSPTELRFSGRLYARDRAVYLAEDEPALFRARTQRELEDVEKQIDILRGRLADLEEQRLGLLQQLQGEG